MKKQLIALILATGTTCAAVAENDLADIQAKIAAVHEIKNVDTFYGFDRVIFDFNGYEAWVVCPRGKSRADKPWTWTMQWATAFVPRTNVPQMLEDGYYHVTLLSFALKMNEQGLNLSRDYQKFLVETLGFAPKAFLIGMSWGGFFSIRYAATFPQDVAKIYLDAPLLNLMGRDTDKNGIWKDAQPADGNWTDDPRMPINLYAPVAQANIPILLLYGDQDQVVNPQLNCELFAARFKRNGGNIEVIPRKMYGHHPHGVALDDLTIKKFFEKE